MRTFWTVNPTTGARINEHQLISDEGASQKLELARTSFPAWAQRSRLERAEILRAIATGHRARAQELAKSVSQEMGKPITQALGEIELSASIYEYYADKGPEYLKDEPLEDSGGLQAVVRTMPLGPVLGIMPWNFPVYQVARFVAPSLIVGNTILLKHARACAGTSVILEEIIRGAGVPEGVYENLLASSEQVKTLIADPRVTGVSLTGSEAAGREVGALAGEHLKKCLLELGGSDPFIVLNDADMDATVNFAEMGRFLNAGQSCNSSKRFIVQSDVWDEFLERFVERAREWRGGDPLDSETKLGPMSSTRARDELAEQVRDALDKGANLHLGGVVPDGPGAYYPVTILSNVTPDMRAFEEELFGPVAVIYRVDTVEEAVELANNTPFGLGSAVFTESEELAGEIAEQLDVGMVGLNALVRTQPNLPFGGVKASGIGRELGRFGLDEFVNKKLIRAR